MKLVLKLAVVLIAVLVIALGAVILYLDAIAKTAVERGASYALGVQTTLASADVAVLMGHFKMTGLIVANPQGFQSDDFLQLGEGYVDVSLGSLRQETVQLPTLTLTTINMTLEKKDGNSNYKVILENLKRLESGEGQDKKMAGKKFNIQEVVISDINVEIDLFGAGGDLNRARVPIDEIRLTNVGTAGADMSEVTNVIIKAIMAAVMANAADLPAELVNDLGGQLKGLESLADMGIQQSFDFGDQMGKAAGKAVDDATKGLGKEADKAVKGLGDLLGGDKK
ncbi:MAG: hypothetical protein ACYSU2_04670 [Planctomycetota bacterium]|jgi:uncharacterized protein involved in outer membrane biogenesis